MLYSQFLFFMHRTMIQLHFPNLRPSVWFFWEQPNLENRPYFDNWKFCMEIVSAQCMKDWIIGKYYTKNQDMFYYYRVSWFSKIICRPIINENLLVSMNILLKQLPLFQMAVTTPGAEKVIHTTSFIDSKWFALILFCVELE